MCLAAATLLPLTSYAAELTAEITYGFDNNAKGGRYLPVHVKFNNAGEAFMGTACIFAKESDGEIYEYNDIVDIPAGSSATETFNIPVAIDATSVLVEIRDENNEKIYREELALNIEKNTAQLFMGILSDTPEALSYFDNISVNYGLLKSKLFELNTEDFPKEQVGLDLLDVVLITDYRLRDLSEDQSRALMDWVRAGGVMVLGTGERVDDTLGRFAPELLDDMYEEPEEMDIEILSNTGSDDPGAGSLELSCADITLHGGNVISKSNGITVLASANKESGAVVVSAYDFADLSDFASEHPSYAPEVLSKMLGSSRIEALAREMYGSDNENYRSISAIADAGDPKRLPPIGIYALSIFAYVLLAGPGLYVFLKQRELSRYYRLGVIGLSVVFTIIIFIMGTHTRFEDTFYNYTTIIDVNEDSVTENTFLNLRSPFVKPYQAGINSEYAIYPVTDNTQVVSDENGWGEEIHSNIRISRFDNETQIAIEDVGAFASRFFRLERTADNVDEVGFDGDVTLFGNEISGEIINNFGIDLHSVALLFYGRIVPIGDMKAGETIDLAGTKIINVPLSGSRQVASVITGLKDYDGETSLSEKYLGTVIENNIVEFYRDYYMKGYTADVRVIGFPATFDNTNIMLDDIDGYGNTMVTSALSVDRRQDERVYRSAMVANPVVISGQYYAEENSMSTAEPVILEYQLNNDITMQDVIFEWINADDFEDVFRGTVAFYNYSTGSYDTIDPEKTVFTTDDLSEYRPPSNTLTVRYTYTGRSRSGRVALPMISVTGTEE